MKSITNALVALILMTMVAFTAGCNNDQNNKKGEVNVKNNVANGHEYVDLGLPSGTLWATCNVGADKPENFGDYFAWGETTTKKTYNVDNYKYAKGTREAPRLTKYCYDSNKGDNGFTDTLTFLLPCDDAATTNWGDGWYTPSKEQWEELKNNTTSTWTTRNKVNGRLFTAKNGQSLFLPATGLYGDKRGELTCYLTNTLDVEFVDDVLDFRFNSDCYFVDISSRYAGHTVRAVYSAE